MSHFDESHLFELLEVWNRHQDLRRSGANVSTLAASHFELASVRAHFH